MGDDITKDLHGVAPSHRGNQMGYMGYKALPHHRAVADTEPSTTRRVEIQTEVAPIRKCEEFWIQPAGDWRARMAPCAIVRVLAYDTAVLA